MPDRNAPCICGSGKKYKKCCLRKTEHRSPAPSLRPAEPVSAEVDPLIALFNTHRYTELELRAQVMVTRYPQSGVAWRLWAGALHMQGKDALATFQKAAELLPKDAETHFNLGVVLKNSKRLEEAVASYRRALVIKPEYFEAHCNMGTALNDLGQIDEAMASYHRALELKPDDAISQGNWLSCYNYTNDYSAKVAFAAAQHYGEVVARRARPYTAWPNVPDAQRPLNVGLVSGDLCDHVVTMFLEGELQWLATHASGRLKFFAYSNNTLSDAATERIKACCSDWRLIVGVSDEAVARQIHADGIDILIDLAGHTAHHRLPVFAWKPAPVQVSWLGYFATTGVSAMDYLIADPWTLPETEEIYFTEKIWRLPETRLCSIPPDIEIAVNPLPALTAGFVTFGCFNNLTKMNDAVVAVWSRILAAVPGSKLFLKAGQLSRRFARQRVVERFAANGIDESRLILEGPEPWEKYLAAYQRVDIALDPFPYPGGATSIEALWMAVPVLTLAGDKFLSRQGVGLMMNAGLPEWITTNVDDYVNRAEFHARDLVRLEALRNSLRPQVLASPIFDTERFARHFESALRGMWERWCSRQ